MDKQTLEKMATSAFQNAQTARDALYTATENTIATKDALETAKAETFLSGKLDGKNAEARDAQARTLLAGQYEAVTIAERSERAARYKFDKASIEVDTLKTLLRIAELP
jgi:outer membrane protein OmpA-like peptidoglycan-associated protein